MSLFGNWLLLCFCCCSCCWNSLSLKSLWLWLHLFVQRILWKSITTETDEYSPAHTGKKWIGWQQLELLFMGGLSSWLRLVSWCPQIWRYISSPEPYTTFRILCTLTTLWKLFFYQLFFRFLIAFIKKRWPSFLIWEKKLFS